jgi:hypothetical protein
MAIATDTRRSPRSTRDQCPAVHPARRAAPRRLRPAPIRRWRSARKGCCPWVAGSNVLSMRSPAGQGAAEVVGGVDIGRGEERGVHPHRQ